MLTGLTTGDEIWAYGYVIENKAKSQHLKLSEELIPKKTPKAFSDVKALHHGVLPEGQ